MLVVRTRRRPPPPMPAQHRPRAETAADPVPMRAGEEGAMRPPVIVCERCDTIAHHWRTVGAQWLCESCIRAVDDHTRWCACGLLLAGSTRQILAMCEVHWRTCGTWQLLTYDPRELVPT